MECILGCECAQQANLLIPELGRIFADTTFDDEHGDKPLLHHIHGSAACSGEAAGSAGRPKPGRTSFSVKSASASLSADSDREEVHIAAIAEHPRRLAPRTCFFRRLPHQPLLESHTGPLVPCSAETMRLIVRFV